MIELAQILESSKYSTLPFDDNSLNNTLNKIINFANLEKGWNFGNGDSFDGEIIRASIIISSQMKSCGFFQTDAFPGNNGEIMLTIYDKDKYFEFILKSKNDISYTYEVNDTIKEEENKLSLAQVLTLISEKGKKTHSWNTFELSIPKDIGTEENIVSLVSRSKITADQYPLLAESAWRPKYVLM